MDKEQPLPMRWVLLRIQMTGEEAYRRMTRERRQGSTEEDDGVEGLMTEDGLVKGDVVGSDPKIIAVP